MTKNSRSSIYRHLVGGRLLTCDSNNPIIEDGEIWIRDDRIAALGRVGDVARPDNAINVEETDVSGRLIIPGLINGHSHSYAALLKGSVDTQPLDIYMLNVIAKNSNRSPREVYVSTLVDCITMIRTGTTGVIDHFSHRPALTDEALEAVMQAFQDSGMRAAVAPMFADLPYVETIPLNAEALPDDIRKIYAEMPRPNIGAYFEVLENALAGLDQFDGRVGLLLGIDGPQRCSEELLDAAATFQNKHHLGLHTHMLETKTQALMAGDKGLVRDLLDRGILNEKSTLVHFIWCDDDDIAAAKEADATLVHCPTSTVLVGSGISPILRLHRQGLPIAIGTDGANCGPVCLFEKIRLATLLQHVTEPDFESWLTSEEMFKMAMEGGARALGCPGEIGVLRAGAKADLTVVDPTSHWHRPLGDPWHHMAYYESGVGVEQVYADGQLLLDDGKLTTIDEAAILAEAEEIIGRQQQDRKEADSFVARQYPTFRDMVVETMRREDTVDRLVRLR